jgi:cytochrome c553
MAADQNDDVLRPFLTSYCIRCHGPKAQKADRRFDQLSSKVANTNEAELLQEILDQLNLGAKPFCPGLGHR